jgi:hypothetical protein
MFLALAMVAQAEQVTLYYTGNTGGYVSGGYYAYPYYFNVAGTPNVPLLCDDANDEISGGQSWTAQVTNLGDIIRNPTLITQTMFGSTTNWLNKVAGLSSGLQAYEVAAYLFLQMRANPSLISEYQSDIWYLFATQSTLQNDNLGSYNTNDISAALSWVNQNQATLAASLGSVNIYTPDPQEFFGVAEPSLAMLLPLGVCFVGTFRKLF